MLFELREKCANDTFKMDTLCIYLNLLNLTREILSQNANKELLDVRPLGLKGLWRSPSYTFNLLAFAFLLT